MRFVLGMGISILALAFALPHEAVAASPCASVTDLLQSAQVGHEYNQPDHALADVSQAVARAPQCADAYLQRARLEEEKIDYKAMREDAQAVVALDARNAEAHALLAFAFDTDMKPLDQGKALGEYAMAIALGIKSPELLGRRAALFARLGNLALAVADYRAAYDLDPQDVQPLVMIGFTYETYQQTDKAVAAYEDAIKHDPKYLNTYLQLASFYETQGKSDLATQTIGRGLEAIPDSQPLLTIRARAHEANNDLPAAIADYTAVIAGSKDPAYAYSARAKVYLRSGQLDLALADIDNALVQTTGLGTLMQRPNYLEIRGWIYDAKGEETNALADYDEARIRVPGIADFQNASCWERAVLNTELDQALDACNEAIRLAPKRAEYWDSRGWVYYRLGRFDEASQDFTAALALRDTRASSRFGRAMVEQAKGQMTEATADFAAARSSSPDIDRDLARFGPFAHN